MTVDNLGHWTYNGLREEIPEDFFGFIYIITNTITGKNKLEKNKLKK